MFLQQSSERKDVLDNVQGGVYQLQLMMRNWFQGSKSNKFQAGKNFFSFYGTRRFSK
jgi:hypothetical protein